MIYHFSWAFSVFACVSFVSTRSRLAAINKWYTQAPLVFDQSPNTFISSTRLCDGMNDFDDDSMWISGGIRCIPIQPKWYTKRSHSKWNACNGRDECINCHISAWLDSAIIYSGLNWWIVCRRQIILDGYQTLGGPSNEFYFVHT